MLGPQGIFKPKVMDVPLSLTTSPDSPYDDAFGESGLLHYRYRGTDSDHRDNRGMRETMRLGLPLAYFHGIVPGKYFVNNGLSLCVLHHSVFDRNFVGLRPDYVIEVRPDILIERDGPTLAHAIQGLHGQSIVLPRTIAQRPDRERLAVRYGQFREAS